MLTAAVVAAVLGVVPYATRPGEYNDLIHAEHATWNVEWGASTNVDADTGDAAAVAAARLRITPFTPPAWSDERWAGFVASVRAGWAALPPTPPLTHHDRHTHNGAGFTASPYGVNRTQLDALLEFITTEFNPATSPTMTAFAALPQFTTHLRGIDLHFILARSTAALDTTGDVTPVPVSLPPGMVDTPAAAPKLPNTLLRIPLLMLHGWPGSVLEFVRVLPALTGRVYEDAHGRRFVFDVVAPSLPGYAYSSGAGKAGMDPVAIAELMRELMARLGFRRYMVQGGDWGGVVATCLAQLDTSAINRTNAHVAGLHLNFVTHAYPLAPLYYAAAAVLPPAWVAAALWYSPADAGRARADLLPHLLDMTGYMHAQATRPDTLGLALGASPVALAAWMLEKLDEWSDSAATGGAVATLGADWIASNLLLYLPSITTSLRLYKEAGHSKRFRDVMLAAVHTPTVVSDFPHEVMRVPEPFLRHRFSHLLAYTAAPAGGHFAALEQPGIMTHDIASAAAAFLPSFLPPTAASDPAR